jgi:hypothetical protein
MAKHVADLQVIECLRCENAFGGTNGRSVCAEVRARLKGRIRCVFEHQLRSLSVLGTRNLTGKEQGHIDSRGYALCGYPDLGLIASRMGRRRLAAACRFAKDERSSRSVRSCKGAGDAVIGGVRLNNCRLKVAMS